MFDFLRVAGIAALAIGAAGASGEIPVTTDVATSLSAVDTSALPPAPVVQPLVIDAPTQAENSLPTTDQPRAESLAALVRRHAASETADREQHCLASAVYFEAKGEPLDGQLAVARVILNRAVSGRFAKTPCGVVMQRGQFSFVRGGSMPVIARENSHWRTAVAVAKIAQGDLWNSSTQNALYFHARRVAPNWRMARVGAIGNHVFYR
jgi:N-acetylmuramoyl-L-alanine amidase